MKLYLSLISLAVGAKAGCNLKPAAPPAYKALCLSEKTQTDCAKVNMTCVWTPNPPPPVPDGTCVDSPQHKKDGCNSICSSYKTKFDCLNSAGYQCCVWKRPPVPPGPPGPPKPNVTVAWSWSPWDGPYNNYGSCQTTVAKTSGNVSIGPGTNNRGWPPGIDHPELVGHQMVRCDDQYGNLHMLYCRVNYTGYLSVHWRHTDPTGNENMEYPVDGPQVNKGCSSFAKIHNGRADSGKCCFT